jgi:membrane fusion protein, copper/silver efflux system
MKRAALALAVLLALGAAAFGGYRYALLRSEKSSSSHAPAQPERQVLYWYDPMRPEQKFDKPGKSPFMDMQLVPKYADEQADAGTVTISPRVVQNLGIRTAEAKKGVLERRFEAVGSIAYNERGVVQLQARAAGFVEKLHARAPLDAVSKGAPLVEILYPEWAGAQEEYLLLRRNPSGEMQALAQAARRRLALLGMSEPEIAALERDGRVRARVTLTAPISGVIAELGVREGMTVAPGSALFRIVDLSTVWVNAEVPEAQAAWLRPGGRVEARVAAYPETKFEGRVGAILPEVSAATRTLRARIELANPGARLKPGMFASLVFVEGRGRESVLVPSEAVIRTGERSIVIVAAGEGRFRAAQVEVGAEAGGESEIRKGLAAGERVVLSGQFLIDSEASLSASAGRMEGKEEEKKTAATHRGSGTVLSADPASGYVELDHEPIASLQWPRMQMGFVVVDKHQLHGLKEGDKVEFEMYAKPDKDGDFIIAKIGVRARFPASSRKGSGKSGSDPDFRK